MAMVLQPILKTGQSKEDNNSVRLSFNLPTDVGIIQFLKADDKLSPSSKIHAIVKILVTPSTDETLIIQWLHELKDNILILDKDNEAIVYALLNIPWYTKSDNLIFAYQEFILNLVTAHHEYLKILLTSFVKIFLSGIGTKDSKEELRKVHYVHVILKNVLELVPVSQDVFCLLLNEKFPYIKCQSVVFLSYVQNMLRVCSYVPEKRFIILQCIIEKLIHIDAVCSRHVIETAEAMAEKFQDENALEFMDTEAVPHNKLTKMAHPVADTLDLLMECLFKYIKDVCFQKGSDQLNWEATKKLYKELLTIFDKITLPSQNICHIQYIMFYICSLKQELCEGYLDYLWKKVQNPNVGFVYRQIAAFYIGSLLSRAKYISMSTVKGCLNLMSNWIHRYIDATHTAQDVGVHGTFHSVCQTIFYVFAFRSKEFTDMVDGYKYLRSLNFDRMVTCRLNPLKFCDKTVVQNFASIARNHQIAYVYPVIEKNNRNLLYCMMESKEETTTGSIITTFYPFDPYLLKRSKEWIEPHYRIYSDKSKEEENSDLIEDEDMCTNDDLFSYSSSPGFKKVRSPLRDMCS